MAQLAAAAQRHSIHTSGALVPAIAAKAHLEKAVGVVCRGRDAFEALGKGFGETF
jgi:hypothetical protein